MYIYIYIYICMCTYTYIIYICIPPIYRCRCIRRITNPYVLRIPVAKQAVVLFWSCVCVCDLFLFLQAAMSAAVMGLGHCLYSSCRAPLAVVAQFWAKSVGAVRLRALPPFLL